MPIRFFIKLYFFIRSSKDLQVINTIANTPKAAPTHGAIALPSFPINHPLTPAPSATPRFPVDNCKLFANSLASGAAEMTYERAVRKQGPYIKPQKPTINVTDSNEESL